MIASVNGGEFFVTLLVAVFAYLVLWLGSLRSLFAVAGAVDELLQPRFGPRLEAWKTRFLGGQGDWAVAVLSALEAPFRKDILSWTALRRTALMSGISTFALFTLWCFASPIESLPLLARAPFTVFSTVVVVTLVVATLPNYSALIETRSLISSIARRGKGLAVVLVIDLTLTAFIAGMVPWPFVVFSGENEGISHFWQDMLSPSDAQHYLTYQDRGGKVVAVFEALHATKATTDKSYPVVGRLPFWIWTYTVFLTTGFVWLLGLLRYWAKSFIEKLPWQAKPFQCIALLTSLLLTGVFVVGLPIVTIRAVSGYLATLNGG